MSFKLSPAIQISLSTAEDSANYFTGNEPRLHQADLSRIMPDGIYRIVNDELFQIVPAPPRPERNPPPNAGPCPTGRVPHEVREPGFVRNGE